MADETISTRIVANADFSALISDVHKVTASLSRLQEKLASSNKMLANQIAVMNRSFSDTVRSTGQFSTHFVSLTSDVEKFGRNLDGGKLKLNQYFNAFRDQTKTSGGLIRDLAKQQVALQNSVLQPLGRNAQGLMQFNVHVPRGLDTVKNAAALARTELQIMNKVVQDGAAQVINFGKNTQWTGRQLTVGLTVPLVAFGNAAAKAFREADSELVRLTKVYGDIAGTSAEELGRVRKDVVQTSKEISAALGVSFKETIALAADIAATGKTGDELLGSIKETTRLAVLGEVDRQEAMKATLAIQTAFQQNTDELANSINFLNAVENQTSTTLNDLVEAIPKAGPVVKALGGDVQDLALYLTAMREGGINASEGANAIKSSLASLINPTKVAKEMFNGLGIDLEKIVQGNAGNITATIMELQGALDQLDPLSKTQAIEQLFGKFQFARLSALFENLGKQGSQTLQVLDLMKASSDELADVAGRELTAVTESASGKYRRAIEGLKASLAEVGEQFLVINTVLITVIDKIVQFAMNLPGPVKQVLALLGGITAIAGPLIMLTGLLANFFGNMAKGVFHLKAFFKGGEGFKYLTPEMLAAEKAGKLVEQTFYSDAKAASVLQQALRNLVDEFSLLESKAKSGSMSVNPAVSTMAGNVIMSGGRVVDPSHPLAGKEGTRASSHMVPRSGMSESQRLQQTMFGMVPGSGPVNQKIGQNPQIYMDQQLPNVPGLTTINGVSTGIVAGEAAKHHAMMATLAMQSKEEINEMKKQMVATGTISKDLMVQFDGMLPVVSRLTDNAAKQSAMIVAELRAGTINIEQARARIIQLNLEIERMMAQAVQAQATSMGRTINPTMIPTLNQPVVDAVGKSNMRELFKKGSTKEFINKVAGALGVRTSGAGYNIETTKPRKLNMGGRVFFNDGNKVPGSGNTDTVPAMLTPGEFVIRKGVAQQDPDGMRALNDGQAMIVPVQGRNAGGIINVLRAYSVRSKSLSGLRTGLRSDGTSGRSGRNVNSPGSFSFEAYSRNRIPGAGLSSLIGGNAITAEEAAILKGMVGAHGSGRDFQIATGLRGKSGVYPTTNVGNVPNIFPNLSGSYTPTGRSRSSFQKESGLPAQLLPGTMVHAPLGFNNSTRSVLGASRDDLGTVQGFQMTSLMDFLISRGIGGADARIIANTAASRLNRVLPRNGITENSWAKSIQRAEQGALVEHQKLLSTNNFNMGGMVPGYMRGGGIPSLSKSVIDRLTANYKPQMQFRKPGYQYTLGNQDPLHGPLQIGKSMVPKQFANDPGFTREVLFRDDRFARQAVMPQFPIGNMEDRGKYILRQYMAGNYGILNTPGATEAMKSMQKKFSGTLYRGIRLSDNKRNPLPQNIVDAIEQARLSGDVSNILGKTFIMRRSSWSADSGVASMFAPGFRVDKTGKSIMIEAAVKNRNVVPASEVFPDLKFDPPFGQKTHNGKSRSEQESIFGGKFKVVGYSAGKLQLETLVDGARKDGGPVNANRPYLVGENGPELFVPKNSGGIIPGYNMGGMIPKMRAPEPVPAQTGKFNMGGMVQGLQEGGQVGGTFSSAFQDARNKPSGGGMGGMGQTGMFMGGMGLSMAGNSVGGTAGNIMSSTGMAMQFLPMLSGLKGVMGSLTKVSALAKTFGSIAGTAFRLAGTAIKFLTGPMGLLLIGLTAVVTTIRIMRKNHAEAVRDETSLFGLTEKSAKEMGIAYVSLTDRIKDLREEQKLAADKAKAYFDSYTASGVKGLTLTIQQLRELKERVKSDMPETLEILNNIDSTKINDWASNLKAQMISSGKTVEDATNLIYSLIESSNKAGMGVGAISTKMFSGITDQSTSASFILKNLAQNIKDISEIDPAAFASNVDTAISSLDSAVRSLVGTKDASGNVLDEQEAIAIQFERMTEAGVKNNKIGVDTFKTLKSQRPELAAIINQSDTIGGLYAKWRLYLQGVNIDLSKINSTQAESLAAFSAGLDSAGMDALAAKGTVEGLEDAREVLIDLQKQYADAQKRSSSDKIDSAGLSKKQIKAIQDEIKAIKERADAKKRALRETFDKENAELELQKAKLDLQMAVARGDNESAAAAQIRIQQIQKEHSLKAAEARIDDNARKAEEKQQALLEKDQAYKSSLQDGIKAQGTRADSLGATIKTVNDLGNELARVAKMRAFTDPSKATQKQKNDFNRDFSNVLNDIATAAKSNPKVLEAYGDYLTKDVKQKDGFARDKEGNFIPLATNEQSGRIPLKTGIGVIPQGGALTELDKLSKSMTTFALDITGGKTLSDIYNVLSKGAPGGKEISIADLTKALNDKDIISKIGLSAIADLKKNMFNADGSLVDNARELAIRSQKLNAGDQFNVEGTTYVVKEGHDSRAFSGPRAVRRAMGGYISRAANGITGMTSSQPYLVGERGPELFVPSSGGQIIPNSILGPSYNIARGSSNSIQGGMNSSSSNVVYNIDIDLNGTNVTADDIMRKFKSELALIGAKEGRTRSLGGNY